MDSMGFMVNHICFSLWDLFVGSADLILAYYYFAFGIEEQILVSVTDIFWFAGYAFLALHLFEVLHYLRSKVNLSTVIAASITTLLFITINAFI
jgi:hypothetical protein